MARIRPARTMRNLMSQSWSRYSLKKPRKNYVRAMPHTSLLVFNMGVDKEDYDMTLHLKSEQPIQLRSNALESARLVTNKYLENNIPQNYRFRVMVYPHNVIREHKMATGAGADRISQGMSLSFGRPVSVAARIKDGQPIFVVKTMKANRIVAVKALRRAAAKLSGTYKIVVS
ncbi:MAG TPA: 50S ribosomal protein L16 [Candidatus Baltobacteraceae bacterium]|nr:50S ribosomal protein L16 [Candidatus Baltobacteraceae bacterium]